MSFLIFPSKDFKILLSSKADAKVTVVLIACKFFLKIFVNKSGLGPKSAAEMAIRSLKIKPDTGPATLFGYE